MKKNMIFIVCLVSIISLFGCESKKVSQYSDEMKVEELKYDTIKDKLVRFHVIANSDTDEDQALKLKVRDVIIDELSNRMQDTKSIEEAESILEESIEEVNLIAKEVVEDNNYDYSVKTMLSNENFPDKIYGDYLFPQGNYKAFRIIIGEGKGQNWWCVMFPPLCFVDETKEIVDTEKLDQNINKIEESSTENKEVDNETKSEDKIVFKFKFIEKLKDLFN